MKNSSNIVLGILGAAAAGVVIGMIIAPQKGSDFRADFKNSAGDLARKLKDLVAKGKEKYDELSALMGDEANDLKRETKDLVAKAEDAYNDLSREVSKGYKQTKA